MPARPGDPISKTIKASTWNQLEAIAAGRDIGAPGSRDPLRDLPVLRVRARNATEEDVDVFQTVELKQPDLDPQDVILQQNRPTYFEIKLAEWSASPDTMSLGSLVVTMQPIPAGAMGWVAFQGLTVARVFVVREEDQFASLDPEDPTRLRSCNCGEVRLWRPGGEGAERLCLVELGGRAQLTWKYKLTEHHTGELVTMAKLCRLSDTVGTDELFHADAEIELRDPEQLIDDQDDTDVGWCIQVGNEFHAIQGPC